MSDNAKYWATVDLPSGPLPHGIPRSRLIQARTENLRKQLGTLPNIGDVRSVSINHTDDSGEAVISLLFSDGRVVSLWADGRVVDGKMPKAKVRSWSPY